VNALDYDHGFWPWNSGEKSIETFPFWAEFRGKVALRNGEKVQITYVGQGRVFLDDVEVKLPPQYQQRVTVQIPEITGAAELVVDFAYLRTKLNAEESSPPYAELRVERVAQGDTTSLRPESAGWVVAATALTDLLTLGLLGWFVWLARKQTLRLLLGLLLGSICLALSLAEINIGFRSLRFEAEVIVLVFALLLMSKRGCRIAYLLPSFVAVGAGLTLREVAATRGITPHLGDVLVRLRGNDHLVYQGLVREMLNSGFLRGGEDTFYFQPGIRYVFYALHLLLGESNVLTGIVSMVLVGLGILYFFNGLPIATSVSSKITQWIAVVSLVIWWSSSHTIQSTVDGLSEFGTWILLLFLFGLLLRVQFAWAPVLIGAGSAMVIWIRPNQGLGMIALLALTLSLRSRHEESLLRSVLRVLLPFGGLLALIPLHNVAFGGRFAALPGGHLNATQMSWNTLLLVFTDPEAREFALSQIHALAYLPWVLPSIYSPRLALAICGFVLVGILAAITVVTNKHKQVVNLLLILAVIVGQVVPFAKYSLFRYFPIHNIAIYLTAVLCFVLVTSLTDSKRPENITESSS